MRPLLCLFFCFLFWNNFNAQSIVDSLVVYYNFSDTIQDVSGHENHGQLYGNPQKTTDRFGNLNGAYYFDGDQDHIAMPTAIDIRTYPWTLYLEFTFDTLTLDAVDIFADNSTFNEIFFETATTTGGAINEIRGYNNNGAYFNSDYIIEPNTWYGLSMVRTVDSLTLYMNGEKITSSAQFFFNGPAPNKYFCFKRTGWWNTWGKGKLDEIRFYNRALNTEEQQMLWSNTPTQMKNILQEVREATYIYPNPTRQNIRIMVPYSEYRILGLDGKIYLESNNPNASVIDVTHLPSDIYIIEINETEGNIIKQKFIKQ